MTAAAACGSGDARQAPDAPPVAAIDAAVDARVCVHQAEFSGVLEDFDSTPTSVIGVVDAVLTPRGAPECAGTTAASGRWNIALPPTDAVVDIAGPGDYIDGLIDVSRSSITMGLAFYFRAMTVARAVSLNEALGQTYDPTRAQVMVFHSGSEEPFTLSGANGMVVGTNDGTVWVPGNQFRYLLFTNVEVATGTQELMAAFAETLGAGPVPVE